MSVDFSDRLSVAFGAVSGRRNRSAFLYNFDMRVGGEYLVRESDIHHYLALLLEGQIGFPEHRPLARVQRTLPAIRDHLALRSEPVRWMLEGIGPYEEIRFASPYSGAPYVAHGPVPGQDDVAQDTIVYCLVDEDPLLLVRDLFDTLLVDLAECFPLAEGVSRQLEIIELRRQDENGYRVVIEVFTGRAKAEAALARFEGLTHKQMYWLRFSSAEEDGR